MKPLKPHTKCPPFTPWGSFTSFVTGQLASRQSEEPAVSESSLAVDAPATANTGTITYAFKLSPDSRVDLGSGGPLGRPQ